MKIRRCGYFDSDGNPRAGGCFRGASTCRFAHPEEIDWDTATPTPLPRNPKPRYTSPQHRDSVSSSYKALSRSRSPPSRHDRLAGFSSLTPRSEGSNNIRRMSVDSLKIQPSTSRLGTNNSHDYMQVDSTLSPPSVSTLSPTTNPPKHPSLLARISDPIIHQQTVDNDVPMDPQPPPPPPPDDQRPQPPLPLPQLSIDPEMVKRSISVPELSEEEKHKIWTERIKLIAESIQAHDKVEESEKNVEQIYRLMHTQQFYNFDDDVKKRLTDQQVELELRRAANEKALADKVNALSSVNGGWPLFSTVEMDEARVKLSDMYEEVVTKVSELQVTAVEMRDVINDVHETTSKDTDDVAKGADILNYEVEAVAEQLLELEETFSALSNSLQQHKDYINDQVDAVLDQVPEQTRMTLEAAFAERDEQGLLHDVEANINTTGDQLEELAKEISEICQFTDTMELNRSNADLRQRVESLQKTLEEHVTIQEEDRRTIQTLEAALNAHISRTLPPAIVAPIPDTRYILDALQEPLLEMYRNTIQSVVEEFRQNIEEKLKAQNMEIYATLWDNLELTRAFVDKLWNKVDGG